MKAKQENEAEIALDVRTATRARTEAEHAELHTLKRELAKEKRIYRHERIDKLATYYYKIAALLLTSSVISCLTIFIKDSKALISWQPALLGLFASIFFAGMANYILLKNE